jgi:cytochrome c oxidase assembly factor CtaG
VLWWTVVDAGRHASLGHGTGILMVFVAAVQHASLTALLMFAPRPLYAHGTGIDDQLLGAVVRAAPTMLVYGSAVGVLTVAWLQRTERRFATAARLKH